MSIRNLSPLMDPKSLVLVGASDKIGSLGACVLDNVLSGGFAGNITVINPHEVTRSDVRWERSIDALDKASDLAVVMTPAATVPRVISELGQTGTRCAVVLSGGITGANGLRQAMLDAARPNLLRVVGPNCLGIMSPRAKLNATFARTPAKRGKLAFISQSGALLTAVLDWADVRGIGFSGIVSAGDMADVDIGDLLDLYAVDPETHAILLYVESITNPVKFFSAAAAAARIKPVIAIKAGRSEAGAKAAFSHTGALAGSYAVYRAVFERAGIVMVDTLTELFDAAEMLCTVGRTRGDRLAIVTNGGGAGILAVDALLDIKGVPAELAKETITALDSVLPRGWSRGNPVDLIGDAGPNRYLQAVSAVLSDPGVDGLLVMNCPTRTAEPQEIARAVVSAIASASEEAGRKPVIACWLGDTNCNAARSILAEHKIPVFSAPEEAIRGFGHLLAARSAAAALTDAPAAVSDLTPDLGEARRIIGHVRDTDRKILTEVEAKNLLAAFGIPTARTRFAASVDQVARAASGMRAPLVVKIVSPDISHKSDVGGVALDLRDAGCAAAAASAMKIRIQHAYPHARIDGFAVEEMCQRSAGYEMIVGMSTDPTFGPVLMVGAGGTAVELLADTALALPPIDLAQARSLISKTRVSKLLAGYRGQPASDIDGIARTLEAISRMVVDLPEIEQLDINPLFVDKDGVIALDARVKLSSSRTSASRLVLRPAPMEWASSLVTRSGFPFYVRPVRADDESLLADFFARVTPEDLRFRFLMGLTHVGHERLNAMTRVDYRRTMTFLAFDKDREAVIATAMLATDPDRTRAEIALVTRADMKGKGLSWSLFEHALRYAKAEGIRIIEANEFADHEAAIRMEREMGFKVTSDPADPTVCIVQKDLSVAKAV